MTNYYLHSGGAEGSDMTWELLGLDYGVKPHSYSFPDHTQYSSNQIILSKDELNEGWKHVIEASISLNRNLHSLHSTYVKMLLCRNWFQVKNAEAVFAIGLFENRNTKKNVKGGTGWAVQMAKDSSKPIYVYEQDLQSWFMYDYVTGEFIKYYDVPTLTEHFAGIGTRNITDNGIRAIAEVYQFNIGRNSNGEEENN